MCVIYYSDTMIWSSLVVKRICLSLWHHSKFTRSVLYSELKVVLLSLMFTRTSDTGGFFFLEVVAELELEVAFFVFTTPCGLALVLGFAGALPFAFVLALALGLARAVALMSGAFFPSSSSPSEEEEGTLITGAFQFCG